MIEFREISALFVAALLFGSIIAANYNIVLVYAQSTGEESTTSSSGDSSSTSGTSGNSTDTTSNSTSGSSSPDNNSTSSTSDNSTSADTPAPLESTVSLEHSEIQINDPVEWIQTVTLSDQADVVAVELPADAQDVSVVTDAGQSVDSSAIVEDPVVADTPVVTLDDVSEVLQDNADTRLVAIEEPATGYDIAYETPAPYTIEDEHSTPDLYQKDVTVTHDSALHYTDVQSYSSIPEDLVVRGTEFTLYWMVDGVKTDVTTDERFAVTFVDTDDNGIVDQMQWIVPQLSEQQFVIEGAIVASNAEHLDENRNFVEDVYGQIQYRDGVWTSEIPSGDYVRVTFVQSLNNTNDITIFAKSNDANSSVEVYEKDSNDLLATYNTISADAMYQIYLTNLVGSQDTFDLRVIGNPVAFDLIIDPISLNPTNGPVGTVVTVSSTATPFTGSSTLTVKFDATTVGTCSSTNGGNIAGTCTFTVPASSAGGHTVTVTDPGPAHTLTAPFTVTAPTVTSVSSTKPNGAYSTGTLIPITVTFNSPVFVTGTPRIQLETGTTDEQVDYSSGSGTATLTFNYVVVAGDTSADLDYVATTSLTLPGGATIKDAGTNNAVLPLPAPGAAGSLGNNKAIVIDTTTPSITVTSPTSSSFINDVTSAASDISFSFSEDIGAGTGIITITRTAGNADANSPHVCTLQGNALNSGAHNTFPLTSNPQRCIEAQDPLVSGTIYTFDFAASDKAGNAAATVTRTLVTFDNTSPSLVLSTTATNPTGVSPIPVTATFSEPVTGFILTDIVVGNGAAGNLLGGPAVYTFDVTPAGAGLVTVNVAAGVAVDAAGNGNTAATQLSRTFVTDNTAPTFDMQYYSDSSLTVSLGDNPRLMADIYYIKITSSEALSGAPTISIDAEGLANDVTDAATILVSGNNYKYTRTISSDVAAVGTTLEDISITGTDLASNTATNVNPANEATKAAYTDTTAPVGVSSVNDPLISDSDVGLGNFKVTVTFGETMNTGIDPTISFDPTVSSTLTFASDTWTTSNVYEATYDLSDAGVEVSDVDVIVSGAQDLAGNIDPDTTADLFDVDTFNPTVLSAVVSPTLIADADDGNTFTVTITYSEDMDGSSAPTITFNPAVASTLTLPGGSWTDTDEYTFSFTIDDAGVEVSDVDISDISGATDVAGNSQVAFNEADKFDIDTKNPTIVDVSVTDPLITDADDGSTLDISVEFSEAMDTLTNPSISFSPPVPSTVASAGAGTWNIAGTIYTETFDISDAGVTVPDVDVNAGGAKDAVGNAQEPDPTILDNNLFDIDTENPTISNIVVNDNPISDSDAGAGNFEVMVTFSETMKTSTIPTIAFDPDVSSTLTFATGSWNLAGTEYTATYDVADSEVTESEVDVNVGDAEDAVGNPQEPDPTALDNNLFAIDTENPTGTISISDANAVITDADIPGSFTVTVDYDEAMDGTVNPTILFSNPVTNTLTAGLGSWTDSNTFEFSYTLVDANEEIAATDITVDNGQDLAGNVQLLSSSPAAFSIDTKNPTITSVSVSDTYITGTDAGSIFTVTVVYNEPMNTAVKPTTTFSPAVTTTLTLGSVGSWGTSTSFSRTYTVVDADVEELLVDVVVTGGKDVANNLQNPNPTIAADEFNIDTKPPILTLPANINTLATSPSGAAVSYVASANDGIDGSVPIACLPASGSTFPLGTTTVNCSSSDSHGNTATGSFTVTVYVTFGAGFKQPIDNPGTFNIAAKDRTIPVKFNIYGSGGTEITDPIIVKNFRLVKLTSCGTSGTDTVEEYVSITTGQTVARYEGGMMIYNLSLKTSGTGGAPVPIGCYKVSLVLNDGSLTGLLSSLFFDLQVK